MDSDSDCRDAEREIDTFNLEDFDTRWQPLRTKYEKATFYRRICDYAEARRKALRLAAGFREEDDAAGRRWMKDEDR